MAPATQELLHELGRLTEKRGGFIRLDRENDPDAEPEKPRVGRAHLLSLRRCDFKHLLSIKARHLEHSGVLELQGAILLFKLLSRSTKFHGRRVLVLLDAKAVLYGIQKGRSSSRKLGRLLQRLGAYVIATDMLPRLLYVPTEDMPADEPSRGIRRRPLRRRKFKSPGFPKTNRRLHLALLRYERAAKAVAADLW